MVAPDELNPAHAAPDSVTFTVTVNIHCPNGTKFSVQTSLSSTIREFKAVVAENCDVTAEQQRLIYKGRILKDEETLESYGLQSDHTVHMVKGFATSASLAGADANARNATTPPASAQNTLLESEVSDNAGLALGGLGGGGSEAFNLQLTLSLIANLPQGEQEAARARAMPVPPPEQLYASQLSQLQEMGFTDKQENIRALQAYEGNVNIAVDQLVANFGQ